VDRQKKEILITKYTKIFDDTSSLFFVKNLGLHVSDSKDIRSEFKPFGARFFVAKNTLAKLAISKTKFSDYGDYFSGPVAVACAGDPVAAAKLLVSFVEKGKKIEILGGAIEGKLLSVDDVVNLSKLPSEDEIRSKLIGLMKAAASKITRIVVEPASKLVRVIDAYSKKK
jgi:large subunit ribosomal protein L10